jgi:hypothetical protein
MAELSSEITDEKLKALRLMVFELMVKVKTLEADRSLMTSTMVNDAFDSGDISWMLSATALVLLMTIP